MAFSAASVAPPSDSPGFRQREQTPEAAGAQERREVGEDPGAPLAAVRPLGGWWHSPASAPVRFVPSGVVQAKRCMTHAPSGWKETSMQAADHAVANIQVGRAMLQGYSWREAVQAAGFQISRATAYRLRQRMLASGEAAWDDRRQGHATKVHGAVRTWLEAYYQQHARAPGKAVQALLE